MFKSFSDSIRSLWQSKSGDETAKTAARKRKRSSEEANLDDSDVEILSVKKPRKESTSSSSGLFSFLTIPMNKMSDWVRKKTVRQDHVFVQPIPNRNLHNRGAGERPTPLPARSSIRSPATNGSFSHNQNPSQLSRLPLHSQNGAHENGMNGDVLIVDSQPSICSLSSSSSRRSSCSSLRLGRGRRSTAEQCFQLKEKENYRKLLQQYTTIDLGFDTDSSKTNVVQGSSSQKSHSQRKGGLSVLSSSSSLLSTISSSLPSNDHLSSWPEGRPPSVRFRAHPSHFTERPLFPCDRSGQRHARAAPSGKESVDTPGQRGPSQQPHGLSARRRSLRGKAHQEEERQQISTPPSVTDSDPDVIIVEDSNGSTSGEGPPLNFKSSVYLDERWLSRLNSRYASAERERQRLIEEAELKKKRLEEQREERLGSLDKRLRQQMTLFDDDVELVEDFSEPEEESRLPELIEVMEREVMAALAEGPPNQVLSEGFRLQLTRGDFATLRGLNWLNDEVINFYMNLLVERGEQEGGASRTYAFNTFFYPKLISGGHTAVKRWTRKVDLFSHRYLVVPVHLGVHWCLCIVFMQEKCIRYYDSMGGNNAQCLNAIRQYLYDESLQKRNVQLDLSEWCTETVKDIPQQMNGSDCGMFACMYAESLTRGARITFTQKDMPYFRRRMAYELLKKKLL